MNHKLPIKIISALFVSTYILGAKPTFATSYTPSSTHYQVREYGFGAGGVATSSSQHYTMFGTAGEEGASQSSQTFNLESGLSFVNMATVPPAPTLSNPNNYYDRLNFVINQGSNPTDAEYAIAISTDNFVSDVRYVKSDGTVGTNLAATDFKSYTNWGGVSGTIVTGLASNTTYYVRAKARQGSYSESGFGPASTGIQTSNASITFTVDSSTLTFTPLTSTNSYTDSSEQNVLTTTTNAFNGYTVYAHETRQLTASDNTTITNYTSTNSSPTTWSGTGFGYSTTDNNLTGGTVNRFSSGTKYAGFTTAQSGDPVADSSTQVSNDQVTIKYRVTVSNTQPATTYTNTILYTIVPTY